MPSQHADYAIDSFIGLEQRLKDFTRAVPATSEHTAVFSPALASMLLDSCSLTEAVLKEGLANERYVAVAHHRGSILDLATAYSEDKLSSRKVLYRPSGERSQPFYRWSPSKSPAWWGAHNKVKHSRLGNAKSATIKHTIHAMKGLFLVLVITLDYRERLVERGIIRIGSGGTDSPQDLIQAISVWEPLEIIGPVVAATDTFGYRFRTAGSPSTNVSQMDLL